MNTFAWSMIIVMPAHMPAVGTFNPLTKMASGYSDCGAIMHRKCRKYRSIYRIRDVAPM